MASTITTVKDLLQQAYLFSGSLGEGETVEGDRTVMGLFYLNQLITSANMQVFLPFAQVIKDIPAGDNLYIITEDQEIIESGEIPDEVKTWGHGTIVEAKQPKIINSLAYKVGIQYTTIKHTGTPNIVQYVLPVKATPEFYSYEEFPKFTALLLNRPTAFPLRATYSRSIEMADMDGALNVPMQYTEYLMFGLAYRLAVKYQQPVESIASVKTLFDEATSNIKELVKNDQSITWADNQCGADGWFGTIYSPREWC